MQAIAFYLPQFHRIAENDAWWGEGFTEWTNVKRASPLFQGHDQPRRPRHDRYYNLDEVETLRWQAQLAREYGIGGFCFYHYYFNGRRLLERPSEMLLAHSDIALPFCLSWANESWTRAWDGGDREVLMQQSYGQQADWDEHFRLLLRYFQDPRYIRVDGRPLLLIYRSPSIADASAMFLRWRQLAADAGLAGIHLVEMLTVFAPETRALGFDAAVEFEPMMTLRRRRTPATKSLGEKVADRFEKITRGLRSPKPSYERFDYDTVWTAIRRRTLGDHYPGAFLDWDNTPRRGERGTVFTGFNRETFRRGLAAQVRKGRANGSPFLFVNAWNEWAEGTYLEPDESRGHFFLEEFRRHFGSL